MRLSKQDENNTEQQSTPHQHQPRALPLFLFSFERRIANVMILVYSRKLFMQVALIYSTQGLGAKDIEARIDARKIEKHAEALCQVPHSIAEGHRDCMMATPTNVFSHKPRCLDSLSRFCLQTTFPPRFFMETDSPPTFLLQTTSPPSSVAILLVDHLPTKASAGSKFPPNLRPPKGAHGRGQRADTEKLIS